MQRWLLKTEPDEFSIDDLRARKIEPWNGVRNYQARNFLRSMQRGEAVMIYHSSCPLPGVVGLAEVAAAPAPDTLQFDPRSEYYDPRSSADAPRWTQVDVRFVRKLRRVIPLAAIRSLRGLGDLALVQRGSRLSVMPVGAAQWDAILALE